MDKLKIITILGTRPEIIRLSRIITLLDKYVNNIIIHTGQNYDYELNDIFWEELDLRKPDYFLNINNTSVGKAVGEIISKTEEVLINESPDYIFILGDTNSSLSAYIAKRLHIPIFHMEAGNRCFDFNVPEEVNRRIIDHISDYNLVYTEHARRHLLSEGLPHNKIFITGSPMNEVLNYYMPKIKKSNVLINNNLSKNNYFLVSIHREENVDNDENFKKILLTLNKLVEKYFLPIIVSTHPRTRKRIENIKNNELIKFMKPFGFIDYVYLQMNSICTISDSGTISEESAILNFPAVSIRKSMERPEAQDSGTIILTGLEPENVINSIDAVIDEFKITGGYSKIAQEYKIENTSWRVLKLILGLNK